MTDLHHCPTLAMVRTCWQRTTYYCELIVWTRLCHLLWDHADSSPSLFLSPVSSLNGGGRAAREHTAGEEKMDSWGDSVIKTFAGEGFSGVSWKAWNKFQSHARIPFQILVLLGVTPLAMAIKMSWGSLYFKQISIKYHNLWMTLIFSWPPSPRLTPI